MVGRDVEEDADVGAEVVHRVELEGRDLEDVPVALFAFGNLEGEASADVAAEAHIEARALHNIIDE